MRSPNAEQIKKQCEQAIPKLMAKFSLGEVNHLDMDKEGWVNPCFFVNDEIVMRFNARDPHLPKFQREKLVFDLFESTKIATPKCLFLDDSKEVIEFDVLITEKLPGQNIGASWSKLNEKSQESLAFQAGQILTKIHAQKMPAAGEFGSGGPYPGKTDWANYLDVKLRFHIEEARKLGLFDEDFYKKVMGHFETHLPRLQSLQDPNLIHGDFHLGNMLFVDDEITGVLDFEWSTAGDGLFDCCDFDYMNNIWPGSKAALLDGYGKPIFTEDEQLRLAIYRLIHNIELCEVSEKFLSQDEAKNFRQKTVEQISNELEAR